MNINKTTLYKHALESNHVFPIGIYSLSEIYEIILKYVYIPADHFEDRPDVSYPLWKNYIHSIRRDIDRIEYLGNQKYRFK